MTPAAIIRQSAADGVALVLLPTGTIKARGDQEAVSRWVPLLREHKSGIVAILEEATRESFDFNPPSNPANDDEALQERVAMMMESGMDEATALQEARWNADRERCWRGFLRNAQRVLDASLSQREDLLAQYRKEAIRRYGDVTGDNMADSLRAWVTTKMQ